MNTFLAAALFFLGLTSFAQQAPRCRQAFMIQESDVQAAIEDLASLRVRLDLAEASGDESPVLSHLKNQYPEKERELSDLLSGNLRIPREELSRLLSQAIQAKQKDQQQIEVVEEAERKEQMQGFEAIPGRFIRFPAIGRLDGESSEMVYEGRFVDDQTLLMVGANRLAKVDVVTGKPTEFIPFRYRGLSRLMKEKTISEKSQMELSPDRRFAFVTGEKFLAKIDLSQPDEYAQVANAGMNITKMALSPDGQYILAAGLPPGQLGWKMMKDTYIAIYSTKTLKTLFWDHLDRGIDGVEDLVFSASGHYACAASLSGQGRILIDLTTHKRVPLADDGDRPASRAELKRAAFWGDSDRLLFLSMNGLISYDIAKQTYQTEWEGGGYRDMYPSRDGRYVFLSNWQNWPRDGNVKPGLSFIDLQEKVEHLVATSTDWAYGFVVTADPDLNKVLIAGRDYTQSVTTKMGEVDLSKRSVRYFSLDQRDHFDSSGAPIRAAFSPDGKHVFINKGFPRLGDLK